MMLYVQFDGFFLFRDFLLFFFFFFEWFEGNLLSRILFCCLRVLIFPFRWLSFAMWICRLFRRKKKNFLFSLYECSILNWAHKKKKPTQINIIIYQKKRLLRRFAPLVHWLTDHPPPPQQPGPWPIIYSTLLKICFNRNNNNNVHL